MTGHAEKLKLKNNDVKEKCRISLQSVYRIDLYVF